ncbi:MAG: NAD(P)-dependent oxidoreductase [Gemmataceae bacterium]|nr:NAD(P)-dependent oxidoreductase [Gemmataceae bacterium]
MQTVLVTGATGEVARGVLPLLGPGFDLRLLALDPPGDDPRRVQADLLDAPALARAMSEADAVLHLAVATGYSGAYEEDAFNDRRFDVNVKGTYHVFEAARRVGVRRVVHVSSLMVVWGESLAVWCAGSGMVPGDAPPSPVGTYALTKALAEQIAAHYARPPLEVIVMRIAAPLDPDAPDLRARPIRPQQVPFTDLAQAFTLALTVPLARYEVVTVVGDSSRRIWDLEPARRVLGYCPHYYLDDLGVTFADPFAVG